MATKEVIALRVQADDLDGVRGLLDEALRRAEGRRLTPLPVPAETAVDELCRAMKSEFERFLDTVDEYVQSIAHRERSERFVDFLRGWRRENSERIQRVVTTTIN